ncbi:hypothetical protein [Halobellus rufus]|uniref:hypothetical protein n=1 Tax=Halobellus rufus TaxID=1448860 RepID=UPI00067985CB|nr:hypothetical protein [Halobellus rufus]
MNRNVWYVGLLVIAAGITLAAVPPGGTDGLVGPGADGSDPGTDGLPVSLVATDDVVTGPASGTDGAHSPTRTTASASDASASTAGSPAAGTTAAPANGTPVAALVNDVDAPVNVTYAAAIDDDAVEPAAADGQVEIPRGDQRLLSARCTPGPAASGTATLRVTIRQTTVGEPVSRDVTLTAELRYDCPAASGAADATGTATTTDAALLRTADAALLRRTAA